MTDYINGFSVLPYGDPALGVFYVPNTQVRLSVRREIAPLIMGFANDFNKTVEALKPKTCACHAHRKIAGTDKWSFHAPGIAVDLNWDEHPMGASGTFSATQVAQIRRLLSKWSYKGTQLFRWGGDYRTRKDEMHFEIIVSRPFALEAVKSLQAAPTPPKPVVHKPGSRTLRYVAGQPIMKGEDVKYVQEWIGPKHCGIADGEYGPRTRDGVKWYQDMRGISVDGVVGRVTWRHLRVTPTY